MVDYLKGKGIFKVIFWHHYDTVLAPLTLSPPVTILLPVRPCLEVPFITNTNRGAGTKIPDIMSFSTLVVRVFSPKRF